MRLILPLFFLWFLFGSCKQADIKIYNLSDTGQYAISIDTLFLDVNSFSGEGFFRLKDTTIYYFDDIFGQVTSYNIHGRYIQRFLGMGDSTHQIGNFYTHTFLPKNKSSFFSVEYVFAIYNDKWNRQGKYASFKWKNRKKKYDTDDLLDISMYDFDYDDSPFDSRWLPSNSKGKLFIPINITHRSNSFANRFEKQSYYYKNSFSVGIIDPQTGLLEKGFAKHPKIYSLHPFNPNYDFNYRDVRNDSIFVSYMLDKYIYVYNPELEIVYAFGMPGKDMNLNYESISNNQLYSQNAIKAKSSYGYYTHIYADKGSDYLFRSYIKNNKNKFSGLQVYKDKILISDILVPKRCNVIGRVGNTFYADGFYDEVNNRLGIYLIKIYKK
jgi:hypothetical protein